MPSILKSVKKGLGLSKIKDLKVAPFTSPTASERYTPRRDAPMAHHAGKVVPVGIYQEVDASRPGIAESKASSASDPPSAQSTQSAQPKELGRSGSGTSVGSAGGAAAESKPRSGSGDGGVDSKGRWAMPTPESKVAQNVADGARREKRMQREREEERERHAAQTGEQARRQALREQAQASAASPSVAASGGGSVSRWQHGTLPTRKQMKRVVAALREVPRSISFISQAPGTVQVAKAGVRLKRKRDSTVAYPDVEQVLTGMSVLLEFMIQDTDDATAPNEGNKVFWAPETETLEQPVTAEDIWKLLARLHKICMWTPECLVIGLVLLIRFLSYNPDTILVGNNWRRLLFCSLMISQKFWDDRSLKNGDFPKVWKYVCKRQERVSIRQVNQMEADFLRMLDFDLTITRQAYASCFIEICALAPAQGSSEVLHYVKPTGHDGDVLQSMIFDHSLGAKPRNADYDEWAGVHQGPDGKGIPPPDVEAERPSMRKWKSIDVTGWDR